MILQTDFKRFSNDLASALVSAFEKGENAIDAMNATFEDFIKNAIANSLKLSIMEPVVNGMLEAATNYAKGNNNSLIGFNWGEWRSELESASSDFFNNYKAASEALGFEIGKQETSTGGKGLSGTIGRSITEDTANKWMGVQLNMHAMAKKQYDESLKQTTGIIKYAEYGFQMVQSLAAIEQNTGNTARNTERLAAIEGHLSVVANNTQQGKTARDMGTGDEYSINRRWR